MIDFSKLHFRLDEWQKNFLLTKGDKILCCGRQIGKSVVAGIDAAEWAIAHPNTTTLMIAPTERQARGLFEKTLDHLVRYYPKEICKGKDRPTLQRIKLKKKQIIWCLPTGLSGLGVRFLTVNRLYEDESSQIPDAVQEAVMPMLLTTGGDTIKLSTPFGTEGHFWMTLSNKDGAYNSFTRFFGDDFASEAVYKARKICSTWTEAQRDKALEKIRQAKARLSVMAFSQEYLGRPLADLRQVFSDELLRACCVLERPTIIRRSERYYLGADIAGLGGDETVLAVLDIADRDRIRHVENVVTKYTYTTDVTDRILLEDRKFDFKKIFVDDGGLGFGVFSELLYEDQTKRKVVGINNARRVYGRDASGREVKELGKKLMKEELYNNLLYLLERGKIKLLKDDKVYHSMKSIQFEVTPEGKVRYFGNDSHVAEALIRAAWGVHDKSLNIFVM